MNPLRILCAVAFLAATTLAYPSEDNTVSGSLKPSQWLKPSELEEIPSLDEINLHKLEQMPLEKGAHLVQKLYYLSQINNELSPSFVPSPSNIPVYLFKPNGQKEVANLKNYVELARQQANFGDDEVTIIITGLPESTETVKKANKKLIQAYIQRYNQQARANQQQSGEDKTTSSEETSATWQNQKPIAGNLIVIDLGSTITSLKRYAMMDVEQTGKMLGKTFVELTNSCNVPQEIIHIVAQGVAANAAGFAANEYTRLTGHKLRRITALDPARTMAKNRKVLTGLARGDADFVDAIHTSVYGMGTCARVGDVDFYPNGPDAGVPGAENVVEASMRATRYFAESVRPGNEHNFPAVQANSLKEYKNYNGFGKRAYMGIDADYDLKGDYMLQVSAKSPFGMRAPAEKQKTYHGEHAFSSHQQD